MSAAEATGERRGDSLHVEELRRTLHVEFVVCVAVREIAKIECRVLASDRLDRLRRAERELSG